jgi:MFS family permease
MNELIQNVSKHDQDEETDAVNSKAKFNKWSLLVGPALRPLLLGISLQLLQQWSGINAVMFHTTELFVNNASGEYTKEELKGAIDGAIYVNLVQVVMCLVTVLSMNKAGRRFFLILSHTGMGLAGTVMGFAYTYNWSTTARMIIIMIYLGFFALGVGPIPWLVCSEIYPSAVREIAMSISTLVNWLSAFAVTAALSPMQNAIGSDGVFWFFSVVSFGGSLLIYCTLPETKDKSLEEIEAYFLGDLDD